MTFVPALQTGSLRKIFCVLILTITSVSTLASELAFRISDDTVGGGLEGYVGESDLFAGFEHFYKDKNESINISNLNLHTKGQTALGNMPTTVMLGLEASYMKEGEFKSILFTISRI